MWKMCIRDSDKGKVKLWMTFNEINTMMHGGEQQTGVRIPEGADRDQVLLQVAHHLLLASAKACLLYTSRCV